MGLGAKKFMGSLTSSPSTIPSLLNYTSFFTTAIFHFYLGYILCKELFKYLLICKGLHESKWILR